MKGGGAWFPPVCVYVYVVLFSSEGQVKWRSASVAAVLEGEAEGDGKLAQPHK